MFKFTYILVFFLSMPAMAGICNRTPQIVEVLEEALSMPCQKIQASDLSQVEKLNIQDKGIRNLQRTDLRGLVSLSRLRIHVNPFTRIPAGLFRDNKALTSLDLSNNKLTQLPPELFRGLSLLERIDLHGNNLRKLDRDQFKGLSKMRSLNLATNPLDPQNLNFSYMPDLFLLFLATIESAELNKDSFKGLANLTVLYLGSRQQAFNVPADLFEYFPQLESLTLHNAKSLPESLLWGLSNLKRFGHVGGSLQSIPPRFFDGLDSLKEISFFSTTIDDLPAELITGIHSLEEVGFFEAGLTRMPVGFFNNLPSLTEVRLSDNDFSNDEKARIRKELPDGVTAWF